MRICAVEQKNKAGSRKNFPAKQADRLRNAVSGGTPRAPTGVEPYFDVRGISAASDSGVRGDAITGRLPVVRALSCIPTAGVGESGCRHPLNPIRSRAIRGIATQRRPAI